MILNELPKLFNHDRKSNVSSAFTIPNFFFSIWIEVVCTCLFLIGLASDWHILKTWIFIFVHHRFKERHLFLLSKALSKEFCLEVAKDTIFERYNVDVTFSCPLNEDFMILKSVVQFWKIFLKNISTKIWVSSNKLSSEITVFFHIGRKSIWIYVNFWWYE